ncbi:hypothetical protein PILCRDRAFT_8898 [Piloderma croceum F 1598]|uniref:Uncharacterized protein n=1 Tax=Piloderma croceum (strain F 1598) TaxID=765440 RepID=A0A0C3BV66_PILCF|nr:hypothetical protein PILCRDRAFT_8898 [Piloderma croceum F 1598]
MYPRISGLKDVNRMSVDCALGTPFCPYESSVVLRTYHDLMYDPNSPNPCQRDETRLGRYKDSQKEVAEAIAGTYPINCYIRFMFTIQRVNIM